MYMYYFRAEIWLSACGREDLKEKVKKLGSYRLCAAHFEDKMYLNDLKNRLLPKAVPTIFPLMEGSSQDTTDTPRTCFTSEIGSIDNGKIKFFTGFPL